MMNGPLNQQSTNSSKHDILLEKATAYSHAAYALARRFPKEELFGLTSQLRRAALSVPLNIVEGFARQSSKSEAQFLTIAYGSLKETQFIIQFAADEKYVLKDETLPVAALGHEVARLLWSKIKTLKSKNSRP